MEDNLHGRQPQWKIDAKTNRTHSPTFLDVKSLNHFLQFTDVRQSFYYLNITNNCQAHASQAKLQLQLRLRLALLLILPTHAPTPTRESTKT